MDWGGVYLWSKTMGGTGEDYGYGIDVDVAGDRGGGAATCAERDGGDEVVEEAGRGDLEAKKTALGRFGRKADIANAAVWLAGDECFMTGQVLQVNGGLTLRRNPSQREISASLDRKSVV